jgi:hypothetical protein
MNRMHEAEGWPLPEARRSARSKRLLDFIVEGEQRYWVHVAIDRFTGEVIEKQIEVVNE